MGDGRGRGNDAVCVTCMALRVWCVICDVSIDV